MADGGDESDLSIMFIPETSLHERFPFRSSILGSLAKKGLDKRP